MTMSVLDWERSFNSSTRKSSIRNKYVKFDFSENSKKKIESFFGNTSSKSEYDEFEIEEADFKKIVKMWKIQNLN
ncbi:MAG: hypothetical protein ACTSWY_00925 [Promethearchaeota archaeon]